MLHAATTIYVSAQNIMLKFDILNSIFITMLKSLNLYKKNVCEHNNNKKQLYYKLLKVKHFFKKLNRIRNSFFYYVYQNINYSLEFKNKSVWIN